MAEDTKTKTFVEPGVLYVVPTPIGNLSDITERARIVLAGADFVAAEDTRNTAHLLTLLGLKKTCVPYHEHNARAARSAHRVRAEGGQKLRTRHRRGYARRLRPGRAARIALCAAEGVRVVPLPGACAAVCALSGAGLPSRRFAFEGFLPTKKSVRARYLESLRGDTHTLVFYIAPHDAPRDLADLYEALGDRRAALCRELTKLNEEILARAAERPQGLPVYGPRGNGAGRGGRFGGRIVGVAVRGGARRALRRQGMPENGGH